MQYSNLAFAMFLAFAPASSFAEPPQVNGSISIAGEGIGQGFPVTHGGTYAAVTLGVEWNGFYASGTIDSFREAGADYEAYLIAGHRSSWGPVTLDASVVRYWYPGSNGPLDFWEGALAASANVSDWTLSIGARGSEEYFFETGRALYVYAEAGRPLGSIGDVTFSGSVLVGRVRVEDNAALGAPDWTLTKANLGAARGNWSAALTYWQTDIPERYGLDAGGRVVATLTRSF